LAFATLFTTLEASETPVRHSSLAEPLKALRIGGLLTMRLTALFYNFGFFIVPASGVWTGERSAIVAALVVGGIFIGINNTALRAALPGSVDPGNA
jgi:MFS transporter, ACDE family, multidrug resistance protein